MPNDRNRETGRGPESIDLSRRTFLHGALAAGSVLGIASLPSLAVARQQPAGNTRTAPASSALRLAEFLNKTKYTDLPPKAIEHAKMILASTLASAAPGSLMGSARILRDLAKELGGKPQATIWFDGTKLPIHEVARVNAVLSDAAASDDSDIRNTAHEGTTLAAAGLAIAEQTGATGQDVLLAMVIGYEAAGRIGESRRGGRAGVHASQIVAFGGAVAAAKLLKLSDEQMAHALGITATTMGGLATGTDSWAREYMGANAALCAVNAALAAGRGYTVNEDMLEGAGGFVDVFGGGKQATESLTADLGKEWDIVDFYAVKLWPGAHPLSGTVEAAMNAARQANVSPDEVVRILVAGPNRTTVGGSRRPKDLVEAIHSLPYFVASAVADKEFTWIHATEAKIFNPVVTRLMDLVEVDPAPPAVTYKWGWGGTVTIVTKSGARFTSTVDAPRGSAPRGIAWSDVDAKYRALMPDSKLPAKRIEESLSVIHGFEKVKNVAELIRLIGPAT
ncbi:MAG TPA: MmgE/PrpD family protein [Vicinamibacterales bacterium]|nr:MmgE/PrpD family protein [Vicinamibacterales bacterium]